MQEQEQPGSERGYTSEESYQKQKTLKKFSLPLSLHPPSGIAQSLLCFFATLPFLSVHVSLEIWLPCDVSICSWDQIPSLQMNSPEGIIPALSKLNFGEIASYRLSVSLVSTVCLAEKAQECKISPYLCPSSPCRQVVFVFFFLIEL